MCVIQTEPSGRFATTGKEAFGFLTVEVLHLNSDEVSAILGSSIVTAHLARAVRLRGMMKMCQAANCLKQLL